MRANIYSRRGDETCNKIEFNLPHNHRSEVIWWVIFCNEESRYRKIKYLTHVSSRWRFESRSSSSRFHGQFKGEYFWREEGKLFKAWLWQGEGRENMERTGEVEMKECKTHGLHLLSEVWTGQVRRVKDVWMDLGTLGEQVKFAIISGETGMRDNWDRPERCHVAAEVTGHRFQVNLAFPRQDQRNGTVKFNLGLGFTKVKVTKRGECRVQERTQIVWILACHPSQPAQSGDRASSHAVL